MNPPHTTVIYACPVCGKNCHRSTLELVLGEERSHHLAHFTWPPSFPFLQSIRGSRGLWFMPWSSPGPDAQPVTNSIWTNLWYLLLLKRNKNTGGFHLADILVLNARGLGELNADLHNRYLLTQLAFIINREPRWPLGE